MNLLGMAGAEKNHGSALEFVKIGSALQRLLSPFSKRARRTMCLCFFFCYTQPTPFLSSLMRVVRTSVCVVLGDVGSF